MGVTQHPEEWLHCTLENILTTIVGGGTPSKDNSDFFQGNIPWMSVKDMNKHVLTDTVDHISEEAVANSSTNVIPAGVPIVATRMSLGKIVVTTFDSAINQDLKALFIPSQVNTGYFVYWYRSIAKHIESLGTGTTVKGIRLDDLRNLNFPLIPAAEQKEIADRLDILLAQVEATQARLARIPDIIKKFRQSVLSAATAGNLIKSKEEWIEADLSRVASHIVDCPHSTPKWSSSGYYCVRTTAFNEFFLDLSAQGFVSADVYEERIKRLTPLAGDILYSREGTIGIACQIPEGVELCLGQRMVLIRAGHLVNSKYLTIVLNSNKIISIVRQKNIGSTVPRINMSDIKSFPIPLPALEEQTEIVHRVEQLFAYADTLEQQAKAAKARVDNLTQAILAKAFRGELTADWRAANPELISGDHSAAALLARIQAERATAKPRKRATKTSAT